MMRAHSAMLLVLLVGSTGSAIAAPPLRLDSRPTEELLERLDRRPASRQIEVLRELERRVRRGRSVKVAPEAIAPLLHAGSGRVRREAAKLLRKLGQEALPALEPAARKGRGPGAVLAVEGIAGLEGATPILRELLEHRDPEVRRQAWIELARHPDGIPELIRLIRDAPQRWINEVSVLAPTFQQFEALVGLLEDPDPTIRARALHVLFYWVEWLPEGIDPEAVAPRRLLGDPSTKVRLMATRVRLRLEIEVEDPLPVIETALRHPEDWTRSMAVHTLWLVEDVPGYPLLLVRLLDHPDYYTREIAAFALKRRRDLAGAALPALQRAAESPYSSIRWKALLAQGRAFPRRAFPILWDRYVEAGDQGREELFSAVIQAAARVIQEEGESPEFRSRIESGLRSRDPSIRSLAAYALEEAGPAGEHWLSRVLPLLGDRRDWVRWAALEAAASIGEGLRPEFATIRSALRELEGAVPLGLDGVLRALANDEDPIAALVRLLRTGGLRERPAAAWALCILATRAEPALPALEEAGRSRRPDLRRAARAAIERIETCNGEITEMELSGPLFFCPRGNSRVVYRGSSGICYLPGARFEPLID